MYEIRRNQLYQQFVVTAPEMLACLSRYLKVCRKARVALPKCIRGIFELTWEELITDAVVATPLDIPGLEVSIGAQPVVPVGSTPIPAPVRSSRPPVLRLQKLPTSIRPAKFSTHSPTPPVVPMESTPIPTPVRSSRPPVPRLPKVPVSTRPAKFSTRSPTPDVVLLESTPILAPIRSSRPLVPRLPTYSRPSKFSTHSSPHGHLVPIAQEALVKFQQKSLRLLTEIVKLKVTVIEESMSVGAKSLDVTKRLVGDIKAKEVAFSGLIDSVRRSGYGGQMEKAMDVNSPHQFTYNRSTHRVTFSFSTGREVKEERGNSGFQQDLLTYLGGYPSGKMAMCQIPTCCKGRTITYLLDDTPNFSVLALFDDEGQGWVNYNLKDCCPFVLVLDAGGGTTYDYKGCVVHKWSWASKMETLLSLEYKVNEQMKLTVLGQDSIVVTFTSMKQTVRVTVSANGCPHGIPHYKKVKHRINRDEEWCALNRSVVYTKKQFQKTLSRFINYILLAAGLREISRPRPTQRKTIVSEAKAAVTPRGKAGEGKVHSLTVWKASPSNCPLLLQKLLQKQDIGRGCRCFVKPPQVCDLELAQFLSAPRDPTQVMVLGIVASRNPTSTAEELNWLLSEMYYRQQWGRGSPCIQCWRDPCRLLRYDLDSPLQEDPPLLVKNNAVLPGMVLMFAAGKLLVPGGFLWPRLSRENLLSWIDQARHNYEGGCYLREDYKFSCPSSDTASEEKKPPHKGLDSNVVPQTAFPCLLEPTRSPPGAH
ncbi:uncharacterized protein C3orf20-like [Diceros bicornis minor]|uniref:uncharacterized protein C3orf20-like n=1 Tax=Diceros bicornis minor TaxID=77932 RepID=UPI0026EA2C67|nr:uncharacterized protein C3orf20-like [Diceros bicornis minor]